MNHRAIRTLALAWTAAVALMGAVAERAHARAAPEAPDSLAAQAPPAAPDSLAAPAASVAETAAPRDTVASALDTARELLRDGDYDRSIEVLRAALEVARTDTSKLRDTYLLLIKTYVFLGNDLKFKPQGREASSLNYQEARRLIAECLGTPALRHTYAEPASQYPPEMLGFFSEARHRLFGAFRVQEVFPANAVMLLDGDTLRVPPGETTAGDVDIATGAHVVVVRAPGFTERVDHITIAPDVTLERSYRLVRRKSALWYATRGAGAAGVLGGLIAAFAGKRNTSTASASPLPGAPDPPSSP